MMFTSRSSPALAWAPQVRVRKRTAQVHQIPGSPLVPPARPIGRRARGRKAPCTPLGAPRRLRTRRVPIFLLLLCSNVRLRFVCFASAKHHFGAVQLHRYHLLSLSSVSNFVLFQVVSTITLLLSSNCHFSGPETVDG